MVGGEKTSLGGEYVGGEIVPWWRVRWWRGNWIPFRDVSRSLYLMYTRATVSSKDRENCEEAQCCRVEKSITWK